MIYTETKIKMVAEFLPETIQVRKFWSHISEVWRGKKKICLPVISYPVKLFSKWRWNKEFHRHKKLREFIISRPELQEMVKEFLTRRKIVPLGNLHVHKGMSTRNGNFLNIYNMLYNIHIFLHKLFILEYLLQKCYKGNESISPMPLTIY